MQAIAWDLFDAANDDGVSIGYGPMHRVLRDTMRNGTPLTSVFSFIAPLKQLPGMPGAAIDARVQAESIVATTMDPYATTETHIGPLAPGDKDKILPVYSSIALNGATVRLCGGRPTGGTYNKLGNRRFLKFNVPSSQRSTSVKCTATDAACTGEPSRTPISSCPGASWSNFPKPRLRTSTSSAKCGYDGLRPRNLRYSHVDPKTRRAAR